MTTTLTWWNIVSCDNDPSRAVATKYSQVGDSPAKVIIDCNVPRWFAVFAQMNTGGVSEACNEFLGLDGTKSLPVFNPFINNEL